MSYRPLKIDKTGGAESGNSIATQKKSRHSNSKSDASFDKVFTSTFKKLDNMQVSFPNDAFDRTLSTMPDAFSQAASGGSFRDGLNIVMKHEGNAYVSNDGGKGPSKMGILQSTAREYGYSGDIRHISKAQAEAIYKKIWDKSGAAALPYPLSVIHFDTYVNSPAAARKILKQSGGNIDSYLQIREQRYSRLAAARPERYAKYLNGWMNRISSLRVVAAAYAKSAADKVAAAPSENGNIGT